MASGVGKQFVGFYNNKISFQPYFFNIIFHNAHCTYGKFSKDGNVACYGIFLNNIMMKCFAN